MPQIKPHKTQHKFYFKCFGVKIAVAFNRKVLATKFVGGMPQIIPVAWERISAEEQPDFEFWVIRDYKTNLIDVYKNDEIVCERSDLKRGFDLLISKIRLTIAEFADDFAFLHAGVVGWKDRAIVIPGRSFAGKTTLVAEFAKNGCEYLSDEYALIDKNGLVHPFPKRLSMRGIIDDYSQVELPIEKFGGVSASRPYKVGCVLISEYKKKKKSKPKIEEVSLGEGVMASIANSISVRQNPKFVIEVLNKALRQSVVIKSVRGEASEFVNLFFEFFEKLQNEELPSKSDQPHRESK